LAKYAGPQPQTICFALWGVEEIGLIGSKQYVRDHEDEMGNIRFYYNMDSAGGSSRKDVMLNEWPALEPVFLAWQQQMAQDFGVGETIGAHSDHFPFLMRGVPTGGMEPVERTFTGRGYGHTRYDTLDKVSIANLREAAALAARLALRMADASEWPAARRSDEQVKALFDKPEYQEEAEFRAQIAAYKDKMRQ
jgi:Zn-dependent M28 family amino/carboxypeptidase